MNKWKCRCNCGNLAIKKHCLPKEINGEINFECSCGKLIKTTFNDEKIIKPNTIDTDKMICSCGKNMTLLREHEITDIVCYIFDCDDLSKHNRQIYQCECGLLLCTESKQTNVNTGIFLKKNKHIPNQYLILINGKPKFTCHGPNELLIIRTLLNSLEIKYSISE